LSDLSLFALKRLASSETLLASLATTKAPEVLYVGEDRITKGNWQCNYGNEYGILCGFNAPADTIVGTDKDKFKYDAYTGNPQDSAMTWVSKSFETEESFLQFPGIDSPEKRRPCNWDDHGETYPLGKGPDLFVSLSIPPGRHRLALYFLNDPNYYEPNRQYTVYIKDTNGAVLSATSVENFLPGIYKNFLVTGPKDLTIHIFRNLSLNTLLSGVFIDSYKPDDFPAELLADDNKSFQEIKKNIAETYARNTEIAAKPDLSYADFENAEQLWRFLVKTISDIYHKETDFWDKTCIGLSLAHVLQQDWQYKERYNIIKKTLKDWEWFPQVTANIEEAIQKQINLISLIYRSEWIEHHLKLELTKYLAENAAIFLPPAKRAEALHRLKKNIPSGRSVYHQPWMFEFIVYEKLVEHQLANPFDLRELGLLYIYRREEPVNALPVLQQMVNATDDIRIKQDACMWIMIAYEQLSNEQAMKKTLKQLQDLDLSSSTSQEGEIKLYDYLNKKGKKEEAYEILKNFVFKYPNSKYLPHIKKELESFEKK